ncbi:cell division protein ZipA [Pseudomonas sp. WCS374]|nr:cell division protein ZipA [Pseudomonas sp. WCS374]
MPKPALHLMSGEIACGKSTLAKRLAAERSAILLSEDFWLSRLCPDQIKSVSDYLRLAHQIREVVGPVVIDVLSTGVTVVLDFLANTPQDRRWLRGLAVAAEACHCAHYFEADDDICRARLPVRSHLADHEFAATDAEFNLITSHFHAPHGDEDEGLQIEVHRI